MVAQAVKRQEEGGGQTGVKAQGCLVGRLVGGEGSQPCASASAGACTCTCVCVCACTCVLVQALMLAIVPVLALVVWQGGRVPTKPIYFPLSRPARWR